MSASLSLEFGKPVDEQYQKYEKIWNACVQADVEIPKEVVRFF